MAKRAKKAMDTVEEGMKNLKKITEPQKDIEATRQVMEKEGRTSAKE